MASLVTVDDVLSRVAPATYDRFLVQQVLDEEEDALVQRFGAHYVDGVTAVTETRTGGLANLYLRRRIVSVSAVVESGVAGDLTLVATDYRVWGAQGRIERRPTGALWAEVVTVTYLPVNDNARRRGVIVELCRLALERQAMKSERSDDYSFTAPDWEAERKRLLSRLALSTW